MPRSEEPRGEMGLVTPQRSLRRGVVATLVTAAVAGCLAGAARPATTTFDRSGTIQFNGRATFPIVLSPGPPLNSTTPWGTDGLAETTEAGVNMYRTGVGSIWSPADLQTALAWDRATAALHAYTWPNLGGYSQ